MLRAPFALSKADDKTRRPFQPPWCEGPPGRHMGGDVPWATPIHPRAKTFTDLLIYCRIWRLPPVAQPWCSHTPWGHISCPCDPPKHKHCSSSSSWSCCSTQERLFLLLLPRSQRCGRRTPEPLSLHDVMRKLSCRSAVYQRNIHYRWHFVCAKQRA